MLGYKKPSTMPADIILSSDKVLRRIVKKLIQRNFFRRQYDGRKFFYSKILSSEELKKKVEAKIILNFEKNNQFKIQKEELIKFKQNFIKRIKKLSSIELEIVKKNALKELKS